MTSNSVDDLLNFAIGEEEAAAAFYTELAGRMENPGRKRCSRISPAKRWGTRPLLGIREGRRLSRRRTKCWT